MSDADKSRGLTAVARNAALNLARGSSKRSGDLKKKRLLGRAKSTAFADLPEFSKFRKIRAVADRLGIKNPFFRIHDGRAGAETRIGGEVRLNFASYDYLGFNSDARVSAAGHEAINRYGLSASASRLVAGERPIHLELESALAKHYGVEDAVVFVSGHATNVATIGELLTRDDLIVYDSLAHNSILVGAQLSGASRRSFPHNDLAALRHLLEENRDRYRNALIVVEGLYSMDGDVADLPSLIQLKDHFGAWLMVDEAHALGTIGRTGGGSVEHHGIDPTKVDIWMGTLSKTLASTGGYIAGSAPLVELLKAQASGFVYSVGLSPPLAAAATRSLALMQEEPDRVLRLHENGQCFFKLARELGLNTGLGQGLAVSPIIVGSSLKAAKLSERLDDRGFNVLPIVYPAVPMQSARLRYFLTSEHSKDQIEAVVTATSEELTRLNSERFGEASSLLGGNL